MNKEIKSRWLQALRSEKYLQGKSRLRSKDDRFCCLGVLCDIYVEEGLGEWMKGDDCFDLNGSGGYLPSDVIEWADLPHYAGWLGTIEGKPATTLSYLNDSGKTFEEIADVIEEVL